MISFPHWNPVIYLLEVCHDPDNNNININNNNDDDDDDDDKKIVQRYDGETTETRLDITNHQPVS